MVNTAGTTDGSYTFAVARRRASFPIVFKWRLAHNAGTAVTATDDSSSVSTKPPRG